MGVFLVCGYFQEYLQSKRPLLRFLRSTGGTFGGKIYHFNRFISHYIKVSMCRFPFISFVSRFYNRGFHILQNHCWEFDSLIPCHLRMKCSSDATFLMPWHGSRFKKVHSRGDIVPSWGLFKLFAMLVSFSSRLVPPFYKLKKTKGDFLL